MIFMIDDNQNVQDGPIKTELLSHYENGNFEPM